MAKRAVVNYVGAGGSFTTFGDVSGDSINLEDSLTFTGSTYSPTGNTQTIDLADDQMPFLELNQGSGGGTLLLTIEPPNGRAKGNLVIHQHASSVRDISITSTGATIAHVGTQRTWTSDATDSYIVCEWNYDGTRLFIDSGGGATGTDLNSNPNNSNVVIESSTGDDATIAPVSNTVCGVMTPAMLTKLNGTLQVVNPTAPETGLVGIAFAINTWNDGSQDWNVGNCLIQAGEESTTRTLNQLVVDGDQGAYLASGSATFGVVDETYVIGNIPLLVSTIGVLSLSGGQMTAAVRHTEMTSSPTGASPSVTMNLTDGNMRTLNLTGSVTGTVAVTATRPTGGYVGRILVKIHPTTPTGITWAASAGSAYWLGTQPNWASLTPGKRLIVAVTTDGVDTYFAATEVNS